MFEPLNDLDEWGRGIQVAANYYMLITDRKSTNPKARKSSQRSLQRQLEQPLLYFFSHKFTQDPSFNKSTLASVNFAQALSPTKSLAQVESTDPNLNYKYSKTLKIQFYAISKNHVQVRLANLEDRFDGEANAHTQTVDVNALARQFFMEANAHLLAEHTQKAADMLKNLHVNITEMNLSGSISLAKMREASKPARWRTSPAEDPTPMLKAPKDKIEMVQVNNSTEQIRHALLEPQRIRVFDI